MKKLVLVLVLAVVSVAAVSALDLYVTPSVNLNLGINDYFRGGAAGGQLFMDFGFIALGLEVKADYDTAFGNFNIPMMLLLGFGRNFWLGAGYTLGVGSMQITDASGNALWQYGGFPNTFGLGFNIFRIPLGFGTLTFPAELTYTLNGAVDTSNPIVASLSGLVGFFLGLKASVGVGLEMKL